MVLLHEEFIYWILFRRLDGEIAKVYRPTWGIQQFRCFGHRLLRRAVRCFEIWDPLLFVSVIRETDGTLGMVPLIINPIDTLYSEYLLGISPLLGTSVLPMILDFWQLFWMLKWHHCNWTFENPSWLNDVTEKLRYDMLHLCIRAVTDLG